VHARRRPPFRLHRARARLTKEIRRERENFRLKSRSTTKKDDARDRKSVSCITREPRGIRKTRRAAGRTRSGPDRADRFHTGQRKARLTSGSILVDSADMRNVGHFATSCFACRRPLIGHSPARPWNSSPASNPIGQLHPLRIKPETIGKTNSELLSLAASNITKHRQSFQKHFTYSL
jgi:hypothetical protein